MATGVGRRGERSQPHPTRWPIGLPACLTPAPAPGSRQAGLEASARRVLAFDQYHVKSETCREMARLPVIGLASKHLSAALGEGLEELEHRFKSGVQAGGGRTGPPTESSSSDPSLTPQLEEARRPSLAGHWTHS